MAQGKLKVKTKKPAKDKKSQTNKVVKRNQQVKKGKRVIAPKNGNELKLHKAKKSVQKGINANIEQQLASKCKQLEEGKAFHVVKDA